MGAALVDLHRDPFYTHISFHMAREVEGPLNNLP